MDNNEINWRQFGRHWIIVFILAILAGFVIWGMLNMGPWLKNLQDRQMAQALKNQTEQQHKNDKLGGQTPEETFNLFISALEKGDTDLAGQYFISEKQDQWEKALGEYKNKSLLTNFIQELKDTQRNWQKIQTKDPNMVEFDYPVTINKDMTTNINGQEVSLKAGKYTSNIILQRYPSGNWKISDI